MTGETRIRSALGCLLTAAFPKFVKRIILCDDLHQQAINLEIRHRAFPRSHGLAMRHRLVAMEFEKARYWFMTPIKPIRGSEDAK